MATAYVYQSKIDCVCQSLPPRKKPTTNIGTIFMLIFILSLKSIFEVGFQYYNLFKDLEFYVHLEANGLNVF